jgi:hypothetical protein
MKLRTKKLESWIKVEFDDEIVEVLVNPLNSKEEMDLMKKSTKYNWERNQRFEELQPYKWKIERIDSVIKDWKNVFDENGTAIPCDRAYKELIFLNNPEFINKILEEVDRINEQVKMERESEIKN